MIHDGVRDEWMARGKVMHGRGHTIRISGVYGHVLCRGHLSRMKAMKLKFEMKVRPKHQELSLNALRRLVN